MKYQPTEHEKIKILLSVATDQLVNRTRGSYSDNGPYFRQGSEKGYGAKQFDKDLVCMIEQLTAALRNLTVEGSDER